MISFTKRNTRNTLVYASAYHKIEELRIRLDDKSAKSLVGLQRGHIRATSETGHGSTVAFTLSKRPPAESCNATTQSSAEKIS